jgi:uncharacterized protein YqeY
MIRSQMKYSQIQQGTDFSSEHELMVLEKEAKKRKEAIEAYRQSGNDDRIAQEEAELAIIQEYLPKALTEDELKEIVTRIINETGATTMKDIGMVMRPIMSEVRGRADGKVVQELVRGILST